MKNNWKNRILIITALFLTIVFAFTYSVFHEKAKVDRYLNIVYLTSEKFDIDGALILAIIKSESDFRKDAVSNKHAVGLMQLLPKTAEPLAKENGYNFNKAFLTNPQMNIELGSLYLRYLIEKFKSVDLAIIAYNAGEGNVAKWLLDENFSLDKASIHYIPFPETEKYFRKVKKYQQTYSNYYLRYADKQNIA